MLKRRKGSEQHIWKEISVNPEIFGTKHAYSLEISKEEAQALQEAKDILITLLCDRVFELAEEHFTDHQRTVLAIGQMPNKTYNDIARALSINYTAVSHAIKGQRSPKHQKHHGGLEKKLKKICAKDDCCVIYLEFLYKLRTDDPTLALEVIKEYDEDPDYWKTFDFS